MKRVTCPILEPAFRIHQRARATRFFVTLLSALAFSLALVAETPDFSSVQDIFIKHCLDCHTEQEPEGKLVLEDYGALLRGGESGPALVPGKADESLLVRMIEGKFERDGKKKIMPPGKRKKLEAAEITTIKDWINAGAKPPVQPVDKPAELALENLPRITPKVPPRRSVTALASSAKSKLLAVARGTEVELLDAETRQVIRTLAGHRGHVNALAFSPDGAWLYAGAGEPGLFGEIRQWRVADGERVRLFEAHNDAVYSVAVSPDGRLLASGSYDQKIHLWRIETVEALATLHGHNGCVFSLAFRPDGKLLASASADRTVKLWAMPGGERRDTLSQALKELYAVAFAPDGQRLFSAGADNRIRVYEISERATETTNPLLDARFGHEGAILKLAISPDGKSLLTAAEDRTVKLWNAATLAEKTSFERQPDWAPALAFALEGKAAVVGRLDGSLGFYDAANGQLLALPKPELARAEPRGLQRGVGATVKLTGQRLVNLTGARFSSDKIRGELVRGGLNTNSATVAWIQVLAPDDLPRGSYDLWLESAAGESSRIKLHIDDLPQVVANRNGVAQHLPGLPMNAWSTHEKPGDADEFTFEARAGQTLIFDVAAKSLGSKADIVLTLSDEAGRVLASNNGFDGSADPFLAHRFEQTGTYRLRAHELLLGASADHFYRLTIGALPYVTGAFPLSVRANAETEVELIGHNLDVTRKVIVKSGVPGEMEVPLDADKFRSRRAFKLLASDGTELVEIEPNDTPAQTTAITPPCAVGGKIFSPSKSGDVDLFRFEAKAGEQWVIETQAAQRGSPLDTRIEVLNAEGQPVQRVLLQAVRNSAVTFRGIDSGAADCRVENWEEMELNQFLYLQGEVVKLFRAPQGPDSGFVFYTSNGRRRCYFDTSATAHAVDELCFIVEPHPPGAKLAATGLPVFPLNFENDDDGERRLGMDSRLHFTAPADGSYLIRVTDSRSASGERHAYRLVVRRPEPDFEITLNGANPTVNAGSGQSFTLSVVRKDGFEGEIRVDLGGLPGGFAVSTPIIIEAGHTEARGTIQAAIDAPTPTESEATRSTVTASASPNGRALVRAVNNFGRITLGAKPRLFVGLVPDEKTPLVTPHVAEPVRPLEITIAPGQTVPAWLKVQRNGHEDLITFAVDNLPHGVIVDNIGLNGVLIPKDQNEREIFFNAARWVPETDRLCYAIENQAGRQTSVPVLIKVRKTPAQVASAPR